MSGRGVCLFQLVLNRVAIIKCSMLPHWRSLIRWLMSDRMLSFPLIVSGVGARMSMSKWKRSHQKMSDWLDVVACSIVLISFARRASNRFLLFLFRNLRHVERK